ncbi:augmin complex subunit dgt4 isoform X2 [Drosophila innubila]|uniref:augmin complex subunit dgt4 isoform X2 n=1 Tax=Drosophila innubila TaxID=198719 RepID=UPI00148D8B70|nr:augmin complex subunit dgt4 isoform X2 [Drosophila innubila]
MFVKTMEAESEENSGMDDILYLLHLESLKRYTDATKDVNRQVEEQVRIFSDAKREYKREFIRLADFKKCVMLCNALEAKNAHIDDSQVERTASELSKAIARISSDNRPTKLDVPALEECKRQLQTKHKTRDQLSKRQLNVAVNRETLQALSTTVDNVEKNFEAATLMAMDQFTSELQVENEK